MQIVYISNRLPLLADTLRHVRRYMPFIDEVLVFCPARQVDEFRRGLGGVKVVSELSLVRGDEVRFSEMVLKPAENHASINYLLRAGLAHHKDVRAEFIMSDDDFRPLRRLDPGYFYASPGVHNAFFMTSIEHYVGFISQKRDPNARNVPFQRAHRDMLSLLKALGMPSLMYAAHMPQIYSKSIWAEATAFFGPFHDDFVLDEWSTYFNFAQHKYPAMFSNKLYETMNWPYLDFSLACPNEHTFELIYQNDTIRCPYSDGELFEGIPKYFIDQQDDVNEEKSKRYRGKQLEYYSGLKVFKGRDIRMAEGCSRAAHGVLCMAPEGHGVTYGPYARLEQGNYEARIRFSVKQAASEAFFRIDMCAQGGSRTLLTSTAINHTNAVLQDDGSYLAKVPFQLDEFFPDVELRTFMAAAGDMFVLESIEFARPAAEPANEVGGPSLAERLRVAAASLMGSPPVLAKGTTASAARGSRAKTIVSPAVRSDVAPRRRKPVPGKGLHLSLVVACYNVELYIDRFLDSVFSQNGDFDRFEVILVDDGSTDRTAEIAKDWQTRFPDHIHYIYQTNAGASAARNTGLAHARGTWIGFPDPDDFLSQDYFSHMVAETLMSHSRPLLAVISNLIFYHEDKDTLANTHPIKYRFDKGVRRLRSGDLDNFIHLSGASIWLHRATLCEKRISFDPKVRPSFEDAHLINRLFLAAPERTASFLPEPIYFYRKRSDKSSLVDGARLKKEWYLDQIENGYLDIFLMSEKLFGSVAQFIQRTVLYDMMFRYHHILNNSSEVSKLLGESLKSFFRLNKKVISYIDTETINNFELAGCTEEHKVALLAIHKGARRKKHAVYLEQVDTPAGLAQFSYLTGGEDHFTIDVEVNGAPVSPIWPSQKIADFMGQTYYRRHYFWVPLRDGDDIRFSFEGAPCTITRHSRVIGDQANWLQLRAAVAPGTPKVTDPEIQRLRAHVIATRDTYRGCYVLMDREDKADDNAEHLYRHMMKTNRTDNAWFVLARNSLDWDRLEAEGFNLLECGSDDHLAAVMNAGFLLSSHADHHVLWPKEKTGFTDLARYQFVFLQHGVTTNDLSDWLNAKPIRLFVTATPDEAQDIEAPDGKYVFSDREVLHSGFPRHDALLAKGAATQQDAILIIPTWRKYLTDELHTVGNRRGKLEGFLDSDYARNWGAVLRDPRLRDLAERNGKKVIFVPHPNIAMYLDDLNVPDWIEQVDIRKGQSYQDLFVRAAVALTCFSSAVSEVAYLQRPVVYFQFDADQIFAGGHVYKEGYFSFKRDGFGPVTDTPDEVIDALATALEGREDPVYAERRAKAFPFRDGNCCERVCQAVEALAAQ
ncbi:CDP-glycerol glycerophosphotransferase family protein [Kamptonema cortianum]|nr:CDP-glycerol glycerophosphotransferase family protein [Kamptonema cortianum]